MSWDNDDYSKSDDEIIEEEIERATERFGEGRITDADGVKKEIQELICKVEASYAAANAEKRPNAEKLRRQMFACNYMYQSAFVENLPDIGDEDCYNTYEVNLIGDTGIEILFKVRDDFDVDVEEADPVWCDDLEMYLKPSISVNDVTPTFDKSKEICLIRMDDSIPEQYRQKEDE